MTALYKSSSWAPADIKQLTGLTVSCDSLAREPHQITKCYWAFTLSKTRKITLYGHFIMFNFKAISSCRIILSAELDVSVWARLQVFILHLSQ